MSRTLRIESVSYTHLDVYKRQEEQMREYALSAVPEPAAASLGLLGLGIFLMRRDIPTNDLMKYQQGVFLLLNNFSLVDSMYLTKSVRRGFVITQLGKAKPAYLHNRSL